MSEQFRSSGDASPQAVVRVVAGRVAVVARAQLAPRVLPHQAQRARVSAVQLLAPGHLRLAHLRREQPREADRAAVLDVARVAAAAVVVVAAPCAISPARTTKRS
jgi:hypothetical protein